MLFNKDHFEQFCRTLVIDTKEVGKTRLKLIGTQRHLIHMMDEGMRQDIHTFVILKGRQLGISTISLALDLYWLFKFSGLQGSMITDTDDNRTMFRSIISQYIDGLPKSHKIPITEHNRSQMVLKNRSRLAYQVAGTRQNGQLGRGKALNFLHATECSSWADEEGLASLFSSLAEHNPKRLYIFESTARGYNMWSEMWEIAKKSKFQRAIFIGWWLNEMYKLAKGSSKYNAYWDGDLTSDERTWVREIYELYGYSINAEQIAWWRWKMAEEVKDETRMLQEFPPTEEYAFQLTGSKFFSAGHINEVYRKVKDKPAQYFRYQMGMHFEFTQFLETNIDNAELTVWEFPEDGGMYVIGADPAYGSSEWADRFCASVYRCYADRIEQVAEYCTSETNTYQFAWVLAHLAGNYSGALLNLEITGPGQAVFNELQNLQKIAGSKQATAGDIYDVVSCIRHYLYRRQDTMGGAFAYQWQTNEREKERLFNTLRDYWERGFVHVNSGEALLEFRNIVRNDGRIAGDGRAKDDRVFATGLAVIAWNDWLMHQLIEEGLTYAAVQAARKLTEEQTILQRQVMKFMHDKVFNPPQPEES